MLKKAIKLGFLSIPAAVFMGYVITIIISLAVGDGYYHPVAPGLTEQFDSQIAAVVFQTALLAIWGLVTGAASVIWRMEKWSLAQQTGIYFLILSIPAFIIGYAAHWIPGSIFGFVMYFGIFVAIFAGVWIVSYLMMRGKIRKMNGKLAEKHRADEEL